MPNPFADSSPLLQIAASASVPSLLPSHFSFWRIVKKYEPTLISTKKCKTESLLCPPISPKNRLPIHTSLDSSSTKSFVVLVRPSPAAAIKRGDYELSARLRRDRLKRLFCQAAGMAGTLPPSRLHLILAHTETAREGKT